MTALVGKFVCKDCGITSSTDEELKSHITVIHLSWIPYRCNLCTDVYLPTEKAVANHFLRTHGQSSPNKSQLVYLFDELKLNRLNLLYYDALNSYFEHNTAANAFKSSLHITKTPAIQDNSRDVISLTEEDDEHFLSETNVSGKTEIYSTLQEQNSLPLPFVTRKDMNTTEDQLGRTPLICLDNFETKNDQEGPKLDLENRPKPNLKRSRVGGDRNREEATLINSVSAPQIFSDDSTATLREENVNDQDLSLLLPIQDHVLLKAWHNPMPQEQPALRIQIFSDVTCVKFVGKVLTNFQLHNTAVAESIYQDKLMDVQLNRTLKKGFQMDKTKRKLKKLQAQWGGYVDGIVYGTTSLGKGNKLGIRFGTDDHCLTTGTKGGIFVNGKELVKLQPEPILTALNMAWHNYFAVDTQCADDDVEFHEACIKSVIRMLQTRGRQKNKRRWSSLMTDTDY